jgi:cytidine deaminase
MNPIELTINNQFCQYDELRDADQKMIQEAIKATEGSYAKYSHFNVGAAVLLDDGTVVRGANQENAAFPSGLCAERVALFAAQAHYPEMPVKTLAIAAKNEHGLTPKPVSPCGACRQVMIETETRFDTPIRILLYGKNRIYVMDGIKNLMPLSFTEF